MHNISERERERVRDSGSIANTKICFEVRATALRPRLHTEGFPLYRPHRESPLRIWVIQTMSTQLLSPTNNLYTRGWHNNNHLPQEGYGTKPNNNHLTQEG